jgi:dTDP-glucose 4,6-dehydratase
MKGDPITVKNGAPYRSYLYAADLAIWLWTILFKGEACHPYNVGSDQEITISDLAQIVASTLGGSVMDAAFTPNFNSAPSRYVPSADRARTELDLRVLIPLSEAIRQTAGFALKASF